MTHGKTFSSSSWRVTLNTQEMIADILNLAKQLIDPLGRKVFPIVNYDNFSIELGLVDDYTNMVKYITNRYFLGATRYTICTFLRVKLGEALEGRGGATHPRERAGSARSSSRSGGKSRN